MHSAIIKTSKPVVSQGGNALREGGPPGVTPSRGWHLTKIICLAEYRKNSG